LVALEAALVMSGGLAAVYFLIAHPGFIPAANLGMSAIGLALAFIAATYLGGLYDRDAVLNFERSCWRIVLVAVPIFALAVIATGALAKHTDIAIYPHRLEWTVALTGFWLSCAIILRVLFRSALRRGFYTRRALLLGNDRQVAELLWLAAASHERLELVGQVDATKGNGAMLSAEMLMEWASRARASELVVSVDAPDSSMWNILAQCRLGGLQITSYLEFFERESKRLSVDDLSDDRIALSSGFGLGDFNNRLRRGMDVVLAFALFASSAPVFLLTALAIALEDGGPIFYRQERVGLGGRIFQVLKFRSMRVDAERDGVPAWAAERDNRVTRVGRIIRKLRIDELPQFLNVLRGDMSIIGPRPERPFFVQQFSQAIPFYDCRHVVKPGITGWAQVSFRYGASLEDTKRKLSYDLYYVKNRSVVLDLLILLKTVGVVLRGDGAR
jgi:sugar transferase (PEP-CTERM system associated)